MKERNNHFLHGYSIRIYRPRRRIAFTANYPTQSFRYFQSANLKYPKYHPQNSNFSLLQNNHHFSSRRTGSAAISNQLTFPTEIIIKKNVDGSEQKTTARRTEHCKRRQKINPGRFSDLDIIQREREKEGERETWNEKGEEEEEEGEKKHHERKRRKKTLQGGKKNGGAM